MKAYLPVVWNKTEKQVCICPDGAFEDYVGAMYALVEQTDYIKGDTENDYGEPIIMEMEMDV